MLAPDPDGERLVGVREAARRLSISVSTIYKRAECCELPSVKDGSRLLFRVSDLVAYAKERRRSPKRVFRLANQPGRLDNVLQNDSDHDGPEA
jgi:excisionase family DNA binding protein